MQKYKYMHISNMLHIFPLNSQFPQSTRQSRIFFFWLLTKINLEERAKQIIFTQKWASELDVDETMEWDKKMLVFQA